ncbi:MAG: phospholipase D-like domain-containing protein, partial [Gemmatimonadetes bacterium]|nr:phospholipase D-like domain-containing protein [Gemmatimonadota bacterium]
LLTELEAAQRSIHLQSFIITPDDTGRGVLAVLRARAGEGVDVRVLYDRFGSTLGHFTGVFRRARAERLQIRSNRTWGHVNLRNHRKLVVIDGKTAFVGGMNLDDRNRGDDVERRDADRDYQFRIDGPVVADLQRTFLDDWASATRIEPKRLENPELFPTLSEAGDAWVQVIPGGPQGAGSGLAQAYFGAVAAARQSVTVVTPYFLPDDAIFEALRYAALRGLQVRVVLPARSNHRYTAHAARALYGPLLSAGVRIFERRPPFMHAKALVVDDLYAMVGSANLDYRSLHLNFELNVEVVDPTFLAALARQIESEIAASDEVSLERHQARPLLTRLGQNLCRLLQPVL